MLNKEQKILGRGSYSLPTCFEIPVTALQISHLLLYSLCRDWILLLKIQNKMKAKENITPFWRQSGKILQQK